MLRLLTCVKVVTWLKEVMGEVQRQMDANGTEGKYK